LEKLPQFNDYTLLPITYEHLYRTTLSSNERRLPNPDPGLFMKSAKLSQLLLNDAKKVIDTFASSPPFAKRLMTAAQESKNSVVTTMIQQIGVQTVPDIHYNPDGIRLDFHSKMGEDLGHVIISLKWGNL
jgi:hypothetical protein